jgi:hypothetical protein
LLLVVEVLAVPLLILQAVVGVVLEGYLQDFLALLLALALL